MYTKVSGCELVNVYTGVHHARSEQRRNGRCCRRYLGLLELELELELVQTQDDLLHETCLRANACL